MSRLLLAGPACVGANTIDIVQFVNGASVAPEQVSFAMEYGSSSADTPVAGIVRSAEPRFETVMSREALSPMTTSGKASISGWTSISGTRALPTRNTVVLDAMGSSESTSKLPTAGPSTVGVNSIVIAQFPPLLCTGVPAQVSAAISKGAARPETSSDTVAGFGPVLLTVTVAVEVSPISVSGNGSGTGSPTVTTGAARCHYPLAAPAEAEGAGTQGGHRRSGNHHRCRGSQAGL